MLASTTVPYPPKKCRLCTPGAVIENRHMHLAIPLLLSFHHGHSRNAHASVPVPYAGKVSIDGKNFTDSSSYVCDYTASNDMVWDSGVDPIEVPCPMVAISYCSVVRACDPCPPPCFMKTMKVFGVYADLPSDDVAVAKDLQRITAQPYALLRRWRRWQMWRIVRRLQRLRIC